MKYNNKEYGVLLNYTHFKHKVNKKICNIKKNLDNIKFTFVFDSGWKENEKKKLL